MCLSWELYLLPSPSLSRRPATPSRVKRNDSTDVAARCLIAIHDASKKRATLAQPPQASTVATSILTSSDAKVEGSTGAEGHHAAAKALTSTKVDSMLQRNA